MADNVRTPTEPLRGPAMPQYLLSVHGDESKFERLAADTELVTQMYADVEAFNQTVRDAGAWVFAGGLQPTTTASVVRATGDDVVVTGGPHNQAKEPLGGFWVIEAADVDAALTWAKAASAACRGPVEVRPFQEEPEPPAT